MVNPFEEYKDYSDGTPQKKAYDFYEMRYDNYLEKYYKEQLIPHQWMQMQKNCIDKAFEYDNDKDFNDYLRSILWPIPAGDASCFKKNYELLKKVQASFPDDILKFFSMMIICAGFLEKYGFADLNE